MAPQKKAALKPKINRLARHEYDWRPTRRSLGFSLFIPSDDHSKIRFCLLGLVILMLNTCVSAPPTDPLVGYRSPEEYILKNYSTPPKANPVILSQRQWQNGLFYLFTYQSEVRGKTFEFLAYQLFTRKTSGTGWSRTRGSGFSRGNAPPRSSLLDFQVDVIGSDTGDDHIILYGKALDPGVHQVKIFYQEGSSISVIENGVFGEVFPSSAHLCSLSIWSGTNQEPVQIDLAKTLKNQPGIAQSENCEKGQ